MILFAMMYISNHLFHFYKQFHLNIHDKIRQLHPLLFEKKNNNNEIKAQTSHKIVSVDI